MSHTSLSTLGTIASLTRSMGLMSILGASRNLIDFACRKINKPPLKVRMNGFEMSGYLRHGGFLRHIATGQYESLTRKLYESALRPGMIVVDGGAHIGFFSLLAARRVGIDAKILAFEPDPYNFQALSFNITKNHHDNNIIPLRKALSNASRTICFYQSSGTISGSLIKRKDIGKFRKILVPSTTLDKELEDSTIDSILIKLDIEGAEGLALQGMRSVLQRANRIVLFSEVNPPALRDAEYGVEGLIATLRDLLFEVSFIDERNHVVLPVTNPSLIQKGNLYCVRVNS